MNIYELNLIAANIVKEIRKNPITYKCEHVDITSNLELETLEQLLYKSVPNLVITHTILETKEDRKKQVKRIYEIINAGMVPYFFDLKFPCDTKDKIK